MCCSICSSTLLFAPAPPAIMAPNFIPASIDCRASSGMCRRHATRNSRTCRPRRHHYQRASVRGRRVGGGLHHAAARLGVHARRARMHKLVVHLPLLSSAGPYTGTTCDGDEEPGKPAGRASSEPPFGAWLHEGHTQHMIISILPSNADIFRNYSVKVAL